MEKTKDIINKIINQIKTNKWIHYSIIILIGIILSIPLAKIQIYETHDGKLHLLRILGTLDTLKIGQIPPLINQNYCNQMGYSMNLFYPPLVTYIPLLIKLIVKTYCATLKIFGALCIILSGVTMYKFVYHVTNKRSIALFASIFYLIAPYKLANVYKRYAIGEFTSFIFIPIVFLGLYNLFNKDAKKHYYIAIGAIGLMLTHTVTTMYTALFCMVYILFNISKLKEKEIIKKCLINIIFILLVSLMFWGPLLEAQQSANYSILDNTIMRTNSEFVSDNTIELYQLFKNKEEENGTTFLIGIPTIIMIITSLYCFIKREKNYKDIYEIFLIFSFISIYMASNLFPWKIMPNVICKLQYPWRMIGFFDFFISFICGINLYIILKKFIKKDFVKCIIVTIFIIASIIYTLPIVKQYKAKDENADERYEQRIMENKKITHLQINRDYLPIKAIHLQRTYMMTREDRTYILNGDANITKEQKNNLKTQIEVENIKNNTILEFPYIYYPGYEITLTNKDKTIKLNPIESENGYLSTNIEQEINDKVTIKVEYVATIVTKTSYIVSPICAIIFVIYILRENKKNKEMFKGEKDDYNKRANKK